MKNNNLTYEKSGVNIKAADNFVKFISSLSKKEKIVRILKILEDLAQLPTSLKV